MKNKKTYIIFTVTFILFFIESLFHFSIGCDGTTSRMSQEECHTIVDLYLFKIHIPDRYELYHIIKVLIFFSILNALLSNHFINSSKKVKSVKV